MASSPIAIVNSALLQLNLEPITSFDDPSIAARDAALKYEEQRQYLLRSFRWNFAVAKAVLAPEVEAPLFGFSYKFLLPVDCLQFIGIYDGFAPYSNQSFTSADTVYKKIGRYIECNSNPLYIFYTRDVTNPVEMDSAFVLALSMRLAVSLAIPLTNDPDKMNLAQQLYAEALRGARTSNAIETQPDVVVASDWLDSRIYPGSGRTSLMGF